MSFLNPWLLLGLLGIAVPTIIHLVGKRRAMVVRFPAFDLLQAVTKRLARWERLRQWLLLLLRTLAIAALVFALARPVESSELVPEMGAENVAFVIDVSGSMAHMLPGEDSLFERARGAVEDRVERLYPGQLSTLIWAGRDAKAGLAVPSTDRNQLLRALGEGELERAGGALSAGIALACRQFEGTETPLRVVVLSDFARGADALNLEALESTTSVTIEWFDVADRKGWEALPNVALSALEIERVVGSPSERVLRVEVWNPGSKPVEDLEVSVRLEALDIQQSILVDIDARSRTTKSLTLRFDAPGRHEGEVYIKPNKFNGLARDDVLPFIVETNEALPLLVIDGEPSSRQLEGEAALFLRALEVLPAGVAPFNAVTRTLDDIATTPPDLEPYRVVVLANVVGLPTNWQEALEGFVDRGGGLLWSLGSQVNFEALNEDTRRLLAVPLRDFYRAEDRVSGTPALAIQDVAFAHPALSGLGERFASSLRATRTRSYFNIAPDMATKESVDTLLRLENGAPLLVTSRLGEGNLALWLTSLDLSLSDVSVASAFPALMQRLMRYLAGQASDGQIGIVREGSRVKLNVPTQSDAVAWVTPSGERREWLLELGQAEHSARADLSELGVYRVEVKRFDRWQPRPDLSFAVAGHLLESDFNPVPKSLLETQVSDSISVASTGGPGQGEENQWASILLLSLSVIFVTEAMLAARG